MPTPIAYADLELVGEAGDRWGTVQLRSARADTNRKPEPLVEATPEEMRRWAEERVQLLENRRYEYRLTATAGLRLRLVEGIITRSGFDGRLGTIEPGSNVGLLTLELEDEDERLVARVAVEVRSSKLNYRKQYRRMLEDITDLCADLLLQVRAPAQGLFQPDPNERPETIAQRYSFLKYLLSTSEFRDAIARILADPYTQPIVEETRREIGRGFKPDGQLLRQLAAGNPRQNVPPGHPLAAHMATVPTHLTVRRQAETLDTAENRFVRYALESFDALLADMESVLIGKDASPSSQRLLTDIGGLRRSLSGTLGSNLFREVSPPTMLVLGSPVLQRRAGYREILRAWLRFSAAARLVWEGGLDVYGGGKRDVANLYEYWVFFQLLDAITQTFGLPKPTADKLIEATGDGFGLKLKAGKQLIIDGVTLIRGRELCVRFAYNRSFSGKTPEVSYPEPGSWTRIMRPDYTLSIWPAALDEGQAERYELMTHIHFDAKYKLDPGRRVTGAKALFGAEGTDAISEEKNAAKTGKASKRADLLTLHAYRDAIRRTEGAYVIYPGDVDRKWSSYHELLPGLGAFAIKPNEADAGLAVLREFLRDVTEQVSNRAATRERTRYYLHYTNTAYLAQDVAAAFPETTLTGARALPPQDHILLDCTIRSEAQALWLSGTLKFDVPLVGAITPELVGARHLLVRSMEADTQPTLYRVRLVEVLSGAILSSLGHSEVEAASIYLVYTVELELNYKEIAWRTRPVIVPGDFILSNLANIING